jgi:hypothetical protein
MIVLFRRKPSRREYINFIEAYIERGNEWVRAAFYSDPDVENILNLLYERWQASGGRGEPIDYATDEEIEALYQIARRYASLTPYEAYTIYMRRLAEREEKGENAA